MTLATPARVTTVTSHAQAVRAPALMLFPAAVACGLGLGLAALAALAPPPRIAPLPAISALATPEGTPLAAPEAARDWAALFGAAPVAAPAPPPQAAPAPPPEPAFDPLDDFDPDLYVLRGLAVATDETEGFALLETPDGAMVVRAGDLLPEGYEVLDITPEGIEIDIYGESVVLGFQEDSQSVDGDAYDGAMGSRFEGPSDSRSYRAPDEDALPPGYERGEADIRTEMPPSTRMRRTPGFPVGAPPGDIGLPRFGLSR